MIICRWCVTAIAVVVLLGCSREPPKCSDEKTFSLVRQIVLNQLGGSEGLTETEIKENLKIALARPTAYDEKIKKFNCEAKLIAGDLYQLPIQYESQLDDSDQQIVAVGGIARADLIGIRTGLIEGIRKSRGGNSDGAPPLVQSNTPTTSGTSDLAGTWKGTLEGDGEMEIKSVPTGFDVSLRVSSPQGCGGSIQGLGTLAGDVLTLTKNDDGQTCIISIKISGDTTELDENGCASYHGAACGFSGVLKKVK